MSELAPVSNNISQDPLSPVINQQLPAVNRNSNRNKLKLGLIISIALLLIGGISFALLKPANKNTLDNKVVAPPAKIVRIGISMDTVQGQRWEKDRQYLEENAKKLGALTSFFVADANDKLQIEQIENLISQKVDVLLVIPHSSEALATTIGRAQQAGIKVISYDRLLLGSNVDLYVSFNNDQVGKNSAQYVIDALPAGKVANIAYVGGAATDNNATLIRKAAMSVLDPLVASGKIKIVYDKPTVDWQIEFAYKDFKQFLDKGNTVDGVVAANDGTASGAIRALAEKGLAGKVPVTGQDADLTALHKIVDGTQTMTNYKSIQELAKQAIQAAVDYGNGKQPVTNATVDNKFMQVPSYLLQPVPVTKTNIMQTVVREGFWTEKEIYRK